MIDVILQFDGNRLSPSAEVYLEELRQEFKTNQLIRARLTAASKPTGKLVEQLNLLHACFELVVDGSPNPLHNTKENVKMACKIGIDYRDTTKCFVRPDGGVQFAYRSFSLNDLKGHERQAVMQQAFEWCSCQIDMTVDDMVTEAQSRMWRNR